MWDQIMYWEALSFLKLFFGLLIPAIELYLVICGKKRENHIYNVMAEMFVQWSAKRTLWTR